MVIGMKNIFRILTLASLLALTSCGGDKGFQLYNNSKTAVDGDLTIRFEKSTEYKFSGSVDLTFYLYFLNKSPKAMTIKANSAKIYRESNKAEYNVGSTTFMFGQTLELQCDIERSAIFTSTLPTLTTEENYYFVFEFNSKKLTYHFYDDPSLNQSSNSLSSSSKK